MLAHGDEAAEPEAVARFDALVRRRLAGEPIAYLTGGREFHGLRFEVGPGVLIPRPETETLVEWALQCAAPGATLVDLGTGSGAVAVAVAHARPDLAVHATDRSAAALDAARGNARRLLGARPGAAGTPGGSIAWHAGDWWQALPPGAGPFDLAVSNPPYIAADDPHLVQGDLRFEPPEALTDGADGLQAIRAIVTGAAGRLRPGGWLLLEHGAGQAGAVAACLAAHGWQAIETRRDLAGHARCTGARSPAAPGIGLDRG